MEDELAGQTIRGFLIKRRVSQGGMGTVYEAESVRDGRAVALKFPRSRLLREPGYVARFLREAQLAAKIRHPNVVQTHEVVETGEAGPFIVMEYVRGRPLSRLIAGGDLGLVRAVEIAGQMARALAVIHAAGVVHRDISPKNVLVEFTGQAKLMDFGIARTVKPPAEADTIREGDEPSSGINLLGAPAYVSPEQLEGKGAGHRSDFYSLGVVIYEMVAGRVPHHSADPKEFRRLIVEVAAPPLRRLVPSAPESLEALLRRMLAKSPEERPRSAEEIADALDEILIEVRRAAGEISSLPAVHTQTEQIGSYAIVRRIGAGPLGTVYEGRHFKTGERAAVKVIESGLSRDAAYVKRFNAEAERAERASHPNLAKVIEHGASGTRLFLASEFVEGVPLAWSPPLSLGIVPSLEIVRRLATALQAVHDLMLLSLRVHPGNVLMLPGGEPKLTDFGLATPRRRELVPAQLAKEAGPALPYWSPEQCGAIAPSERSDVYALGAVLFEMVTGRPPFRPKGEWELLQMILDSPPPSAGKFNPKVPGRVQAILDKALAKRPANRHPGAGDLAADLEEALRELGSHH